MKEKSLKNLSLIYKVFIPVVVFGILSIVAIILYFHFIQINKEIKRDFDISYNIVQEKLAGQETKVEQKLLLAAMSIARNPEIVKAFEIYFLDTGSYIINQQLLRIIPTLEQNIHPNVKVHLHVPPGETVLRSWSNVKGDDLSSRTILTEVYSSQQPVSGIDLGENGLVITGIFPIVNDENTIIGSAEVIVPFSVLNESFGLSEDEKVSVLLKREHLNKVGSYYISNAGLDLENYIAPYEDFTSIHIGMIYPDSLNKSETQSVNIINGGFGFALIPLSNYKNNTIGVFIYQKNLTDTYQYYFRFNIKIYSLFTIIMFITILIMVFTLRSAIIVPLKQILKTLIGLAKGQHNRRIRIKSSDEIGRLKRAINHLNENLINIEHFAHQIGEGKFNASFKPRSKKDSLAFTLIDMKEKLKKAKEDAEKRSEEEKKREWQTNGVGIIYEILRQFSQNGEELFYKVIAKIVKYINANQGGIFILDNSGEYLELKGCYAYDRNKYLQKKVHVKEGLIGRCFQEKEYINISQLPESYMKIVSGVGEKSPGHLLLVPLMHDEEVKGIIELAAFEKFGDHVVEFVQEITTQLSSALNDFEYAEKTKRLLDESRDKEQRLTQQEEEMRQNMEEMKATQEEFERREKELLKKIEDLEKLTKL